ncbi:MAG: FHA domain-containing protein [Candidatus Binatia bacterium]
MIPFDQLQEIRLTVVRGVSAGSAISFPPQPRTLRIGRALDNDIVVEDAAVSRLHARLEIRADGCRIADAGSRTGVELEGAPIGTETAALEDGAEFTIADTTFRLELVPVEGTARPSPGEEEPSTFLLSKDIAEVRLTVIRGPAAGSSMSFPARPRTLQIGRALENDIVVNDPAVSRLHARLEILEEGCRIADAGSRGGLEIGGIRIGTEWRAIADGEEFTIGDTTIRLDLVAK